MATSVPKATREFMEKWGVQSDEVWPVPGGRAYAVKHSALERIAAEQNITFGVPTIIEADGSNKVYALWLEAKLGERSEWATGEASPANNKNGYPLAMAEKRAKDRCILKLLVAHGAIYSEEEADDFQQSRREQDADVIGRSEKVVLRHQEGSPQGLGDGGGHAARLHDLRGIEGHRRVRTVRNRHQGLAEGVVRPDP